MRQRLRTPAPNSGAVRWHGAEDPDEAADVLVGHGRRFARATQSGGVLLVVGERGPFHRAVESKLDRAGLAFRRITTDDVDALTEDQVQGVAGILCCYTRSADITRLARLLASRPLLSTVAFEYISGLDPEREFFDKYDEYAQTWFVSPVLLDEPTPYQIYRESLDLFEQKCGLRDYLDLYQLLASVIDRKIGGDVAEFGSYRGHSGWLIARTLEVLGSDKQLFMFDTFESFPDEPLGVDHFWSGTHEVDFDEVRAKLGRFENVHLVKGDFTETLRTSGLGTVSLAYVDCDSYRATRYLIDALLADRVTDGGVLVCEDYGHPALLGNRIAVHESLSSASTYLHFFSQFSGLYVVVTI